jgi:hypothetical protein
MRKILFISGIGLIIIFLVYCGIRIFSPFTGPVTKTDKPENQAVTFRISSGAFTDGSDIPVKYTCDGSDISPPVSVSGIPESAKSLIILLDDKDTPSGTWVHWLMWNIPAGVSEIPENSVPAGAIQGKNGFGDNSYGGPCPPTGRHRYLFTMYALDTYLTLPSGSTKEEVINSVNTHIMSRAEYSGYYTR